MFSLDVAGLTTALQWLNLLIMAATMALAVYGVVRWRKLWWSAFVPPMMWSAFGIVFYVALLSGQLSPGGVLLWGAVHRAVGAILILGITVVYITYGRRE